MTARSAWSSTRCRRRPGAAAAGAATAALAKPARVPVIRSASLDHARKLAGAAAQRGDV